MKKQMDKTVRRVKANPIKTLLIFLSLSGGGGGSYVSYDHVMAFLNMPREIKVLRWRQEQLLRIYVDNNLIDQADLFRIFFTPVDSMHHTGSGR